MGMYIPNMKSEQFYDLCKEHGLEIIAVPVPPHGDLIDMNAKIDVYDRYDDDIIRPTTVRGLINEYISGGYPRTIIPAEEKKV